MTAEVESRASEVTVHDFVSQGSSLTAEHLALRSSVREFLEDHLPTETLVARTEQAAGTDRRLWTTMAADLGLQGLAVEEAYGGSGFGWVEQGIVLHELGRVLYSGPYLATVALAIPLLRACGDAGAQQRWLPRLVSGEATATVALGALQREALTASRAGAGFTVSGTLSHVLCGNQADLLFAPVAEAGGGLSIFAIEAGSQVKGIPMKALDLTRHHAAVHLDAAPAYRIGPPGAGEALLRQVTDYAVLALAAEQVGGTEKVLEMAVDYAKVRHQFDRPIGSFQVIKHTCAQILLTLESARTLVEHAAWIADERPALFPAAAAACGSTCSEAFAAASYDALHIHGGLGFTWEHPAHLYFRRARSDEHLFGSPDTHRERLAAYVTGHSG
jgi:alkylation response protein AidB-like acyl-CoA dehydrogenase